MKIDLPQSLEEWNARGQDFLPGHLGLIFTHVAREWVEAHFTVGPEHLSWNGFLHAASVVTLADTCCGYGTVAGLPEGADGFTTLDLTSNFVCTAREGEGRCIAEPIHTGRTTQVWNATVSATGTGRSIAHFRCTQLILWPRG